jgi:hypothetical protein
MPEPTPEPVEPTLRERAEAQRAEAADVLHAVADLPITGFRKVFFKVKLDPATGIGLFVPGLFIMALGGAATWHWIFNIGSGIMLLGMVYFVVAIALTAIQQRWSGRAGGAQRPAVSAG